MKGKSCRECSGFGYIKENGQVVCKWGINFDFTTYSYNPAYANVCKGYRKSEPKQAEKESTCDRDKAIIKHCRNMLAAGLPGVPEGGDEKI
jgi:hypothetical protein